MRRQLSRQSNRLFNSQENKVELNTHFIGKTTELLVATEFLKRGYQVSQPLVSDSRYDFIIDIKGKLLRFQVKTSHAEDDNSYIIFATSSSHTNTERTINKSYSANEIDYFVTYYEGQCYVISVNEAANRYQRLRFKPPKNGNQKNIKFAENYTLDKFLETLI